MGGFETVASGMLMATIMGGTVLTLLGATPFVFNEDIAWSICLVTGSLFAMLGVLERPSWGRVVTSGLFLLAANLDRATTAWACSAGAVLIAIWFWLGRGGKAHRRWALPMLGAGLIPLLVGFAVNYLKFGGPIGVSNLDQVWTQVNAYRRKFLASNHNDEYGTKFMPSTLLAYLRPNGLRLTSIFPFITLPAAPAHSVGGDPVRPEIPHRQHLGVDSPALHPEPVGRRDRLPAQFDREGLAHPDPPPRERRRHHPLAHLGLHRTALPR